MAKESVLGCEPGQSVDVSYLNRHQIDELRMMPELGLVNYDISDGRLTIHSFKD